MSDTTPLQGDHEQLSTMDVPPEMLASWQKSIDLMAELLEVPVGYVTRISCEQIHILLDSDNNETPLKSGLSAPLGTGYYCEVVIDRKSAMMIPNALVDPMWKDGPDVALGLISYFGVPLFWPNGEVFGTVCVLDAKVRHFNQRQQELVTRFRDAVQQGLQTLFEQAQLKRAQAQLLQSAKLASIGSMSAGLAHELNQPLGVISIVNEQIGRMLMADSIDREHLAKLREKITKQVDRAARITENLRIFSRQNVASERHPVDINWVIHESLVLPEQMLADNGVDLELDLAESLPEVSCDFVQIGQVLTNLVSNACHAVRNRPSGERRVRIASDLQQGRVCVSVQDNGCGIPESIIGQIFDPFFTTKPTDQGTGLGLSICYGLVREHSGNLRCESQEGEGACFVICLPQASQQQHSPSEYELEEISTA
mgnify:CR=1 FL=1